MNIPRNNLESKIIYVANLAGKIILENGGETYQIEGIVIDICNHYGLKAQCYSNLSAIFTSAVDKEGIEVSTVTRIYSRINDFNKITQLMTLLQNLKNYSLYEFSAKLEEIDRVPPPSFIKRLFGYCLAAGSFALFFSGNTRDLIAAVIAAIIISIITEIAVKLKINNFFINILGGALCVSSTYYIFTTQFISEFSTTIIATIMLLVPGISFTNSIRDLIHGELITGVSRVIEAILVALALALGSGVTLSFLLKHGGFLNG